jgi:hypothetical protein
MTIFTSGSRLRKRAHTMGLAAAAWAMTSILSASPLVFPANQQTQGAVEINSDFGSCQSGFGFAQTGPTCTFTGSLNYPGYAFPGSVNGTATAYTDALGMHSAVDLSGVDFESATAEAESSYMDTITNNSHVTAIFQFGFHVDATLTATGGGASSYLDIQVWHGLAGSAFQDIGMGGANPNDGATQTWLYSGNVGVDLNATTSAITLAPGASYTISFTLDADAQTYQLPGTTAFGGPPQGSVDALNTFTITSFSAKDANGNALPASDFSSADGANYASIDLPSTSAPEPATFGLCGAFLVLLSVMLRRRKVVQLYKALGGGWQ